MAKKKTKPRARVAKRQYATRTKSKRGAKPSSVKFKSRPGVKSTKKALRATGLKTKRVSTKKTKRGASGKKETRKRAKKSTTGTPTGSPASIRRLKGGATKISIVVTGTLKRKSFGNSFEAINKLSKALAPVVSFIQQSAWNIEAKFIGRAVDPSDVLPFLLRNSEPIDTGARSIAIGVQFGDKGPFQILSHKSHTLDNALGEYEDNRTIYEENLYGETD